MKAFILFVVLVSSLWIVWAKAIDALSKAWIKNFLKQVWWIPVVVFAIAGAATYILQLFEVKLF